MVQKCSLLNALEVFFIEPTTIHFIKEISKKIRLSPTSVRNHIKSLLKLGLIKRKKASPFDGFVADRENDDFIFYKRVYNLYSLKNLKYSLINSLYPKLIVVYGSYSLGEDIEESDIDVFILTRTKKDIYFDGIESELKRKIHVITVENMNKIDKSLQNKIYNGMVIYGSF